MDDLTDPTLWFNRISWQFFRGTVLAAGIGMMLADTRGAHAERRNFVSWSIRLVLFMILSNKHVLLRLQSYLRYSRRLLGVARSMQTLHSATTDDAHDALVRAIQEGQAHQTRQYTVYWPDAATATAAQHESIKMDSTTMSKPSSTKLLFILFLPGLGVSDVAYAPPMLKLLLSSQRRARRNGSSATEPAFTSIAAVAVVATDPLRVPSPLLGYTADYLRRNVMNPVVKDTLRRQTSRQIQYSDEDIRAAEWILMGHSLGSLTAASAAKELNVRRVVLWGPAPYLTHVPDLVAEASDMTRQNDDSTTCSSPLHVLVIQGSHDGLVRDLVKAQPDAMDQFWERFPTDATQRVVLLGGAHAGFAHYTPVYKEHGDNDEEIVSREEQQDAAISETLAFFES